jgi:hypothetical protein
MTGLSFGLTPQAAVRGENPYNIKYLSLAEGEELGSNILRVKRRNLAP